MASAGAALGVEVEQLPGQGAGGAAGAGLHVLPAFPTQGRERRRPPGADVAAQLGELVGGDVDPVLALVFEVEVVAGYAADLAGLEAGEAGDAVVLVDDVVADPQVAEGEPAPGGAGGALIRPATAVDEAAKGIHRQFQLGADEALAQPRLGEGKPGLGREATAFEYRDVDAVEPVARALGLPHALEGDDRPVAGANEFLQLGLRLPEVAGRGLGTRGAEGPLVLLTGAAQRQAGALEQRPGNVDVEVAGVVGMHRGGRVLPVVAQGGLDLLDRDEDHGRRIGNEVQGRTEAVEGQDLGEARGLPFLLSRLHRRQFGELTVLGVELGRRRQLDPLGVAERALGEGREPAHRLDLVAEELDPHRPFLGRRIGIEDAATQGELAALLDLLDPFVAGGDQVAGHHPEVEIAADLDGEPGRAQLGVGDGLGERRGAGDDDRVLVRAQGVEGVDPEADQVRRRRDVGGIAGASRGIEADPARRQVGLQVGGQVAPRAVVGADQESRPPGEAAVVLEQGREQQGAEHRGGSHSDRGTGRVGDAGEHFRSQRVDALVLGGNLNKGSEAHGLEG